MIFGKKKKMIDVRELQRRGVVRIPRKDIVVPTNRDGFVEFGTNAKPKPQSSTSSNTEFFGFMDTTDNGPQVTSQSRAESQRITNLDNKIYKLEQRIELLEKKLDINSSSNTSVGAMGW